MTGCVYVITNQANGKQYVGQTRQALGRRLNQHAGSRMIIGAAMRKHGRASFVIEEIEHCSPGIELDEAERFWIAWYETLAPRGYNAFSGGRAFRGQLCDASREKLRASLTGRKLPRETVEKMSASRRGKRLTDEQRAKRVGRLVHTADAKERIGASRRGKPLSEEHREKLRLAWKTREPATPETCERRRLGALRFWARRKGHAQ